MEIAPSQSVECSAEAVVSSALEAALLEELWLECDAADYGLSRDAFNRILLRTARTQNFGFAAETVPNLKQQAAFFRRLRLHDLVLAGACAEGNEHAWEHFVALYRQPLVRAAIAITGSDSLGRDLADALYAELYGLTTRDGRRRCPLDSYRGRGSLIGWLRTTLTQRHVDHHRRTRREEPLEEYDPPAQDPQPVEPSGELALLGKAIEVALKLRQAEDRFLLAAYYLDGRTLLEIGRFLHVHEATVSRKLRRALDILRKQIRRNLIGFGLSRRAADEVLGADPRDLDLNLKKLLQNSPLDTFQEKAER